MTNTISKAKITNIQGSGTWDSNFNGVKSTMYRYDISLDNGHSGDYSSKLYTTPEALPFTIGTEIEYEYDISKPDFPKVKKPQVAGTKRWTPNNNSGGKSNNSPDIQKMICKQSSLQRSVEILKHNTESIKVSDVTKLAGILADWVMAGTIYDPTHKPAPTPAPIMADDIVEKTLSPDNIPNTKTTMSVDDLPF